MDLNIPQVVIFVMEIVGTIAFAASGAVTGIHRGLDIFGVGVLGVTTAVGGGMLRDIILGKVPEALLDPIYVLFAVLTSLAIFLFLYFKKKQNRHHPFGFLYDRIMLVMDSIGLGIFTIVGVDAGIGAGYQENTFLLVFLGTITGVGGGVARDMMVGQPPYIFVKHIYALASVLGALTSIYIFRYFGQIPAMVIGALLVIAIRFLAAHYRWNLPRIRQSRQKQWKK